jgi:adenylate cyclase, class 2
MALEREIKLRFGSADEARAAVLAAGGRPWQARRLQDDTLFDAADQRLRSVRSALRVRREDGGCRLTFKGPPQPGVMKVRAEHETVVGDAEVMVAILAGLGFTPVFRYQKYREEFAAPAVVVAIDETPVGVYVELEGEQPAIETLAAALGRGPDDYITDSYRGLFLTHAAAYGLLGRDMIFAGPSAP